MHLLDELVGRKVTVYSEQGETEKQDVGTLEAFDGHWLRVRKSEHELIYFCMARIRLVKPFESA